MGMLDEFVSEIKLGTKEISEMNCDDIASIARGKKLKNIMGASFEIIKVKNVVQTSRTRQSLTCSGQAMFDNSRIAKIKMKVFKDEDGDMFYQFEQM